MATQLFPSSTTTFCLVLRVFWRVNGDRKLPSMALAPQRFQQLSLRLGEAINHPVHVSPTVFSTSSTMFLEPVVQRNADGTRKDGMVVDKPNQFKLELVRQQCLLTQVNQQWQSSLPLCLCQSSH